MKIKIFPLFLIIVFLLIFFIFYKGLQNSNIYTPKATIEKDIPFFKKKIFDSENEISSDEIFKSKKFYLINIWASWCTPCRNEHPFLMNLSRDDKIEIIGFNYKDDFVNAKKFLKDLDNPYNMILSDEDGTLSIEWGAYGVPETFLIYNNKIIKRFIGPIDENLLLEIKKLIK
tara:strand:+ start:1889 stop:2407 length:519 start_codon:yes stop_codon:yes gene_type:complete